MCTGMSIVVVEGQQKVVSMSNCLGRPAQSRPRDAELLEEAFDRKRDTDGLRECHCRNRSIFV